MNKLRKLIWVLKVTLREKCPYSEFFWSVFSRIRTEYGEIRNPNLFSVNVGKCGPEKLRMRTLLTQCNIVRLTHFVLNFRIISMLQLPEFRTIRPKPCRNCTLSQNLQPRKLGEITVFHVMCSVFCSKFCIMLEGIAIYGNVGTKLAKHLAKSDKVQAKLNKTRKL